MAKTQSFQIEGMDCAEEATILRRELGPLVGGADQLSFDVLNGLMNVPDAIVTKVGVASIVAAVAKTGMKATPIAEGKPLEAEDVDRHRRRIMLLVSISGAMTLIGFVTQGISAANFMDVFRETNRSMDAVPISAKAFYSAAILAGVWTFLPKAWAAIRRFRPDMNLLMVVAVAGAVYLGDWLEAAMVAFLFTLSLALESWSVGRARRAVAALMNLTPPKVRVISGQETKEVLAAEVTVGTKFVVRPGDRIPLDGRVITGTSEVDQSPLTGESVPVPKTVGEEVFAGTVNGSTALEVESTKLADQTTVANIIRMVGEAQSKRAPSEQWVDTFARYYTPIVMLTAPAIFIVGGAITGDYTSWLYRGLVLLVIACPCALVISTPVSIVAALAGATRRGILIKGGPYVEAPAHLRAIAFDKTGTLTAGRPEVTAVVPFQDHDERALLERAVALESQSSHPLAKAVMDYAKQKGVVGQAAAEVKAVPGKGATGIYDGREFWIGSHRYLEERGQETPDVHEQITKLSGEGRSVVVIGNADHVCGFLVLADTVRPAAAKTLAELREVGIQHLIMLSGDNQPTADAIARQVGVDEVHAELLPADKVSAMEKLVQRYEKVAMIGDGINDAPVLGRATVGIAMGGIGSDAAIETADIALMGDDLSQLPWLIRHSRQALAIIRQNIYFSLGIKAVFVVLTILGHASLWAAIAADTGASLLVLFNGLRLLRD
ncbi:MAG: cadmium-translocating P-type ATPase [Planctomycetes bacterium]|nr:cadmium-translocating P-type ATPase [Planctomycetota bacterium]